MKLLRMWGAIAGSMVVASLSLYGCGAKKAPAIGLSIDDLRVERWTRDRDFFVSAAKELGATVKVRSADGDQQLQISQIEGMINEKVDAIVIVPNNAKALAPTVEKARAAGIKVISYDRLILDTAIDAYISFDNEKVGQLQAEGVVKAKPTGNYYLLGGAPTDNNAKLLREGQMKVLKPLVDKGGVKLLGDQWVTDWNPAEAQAIITKVLKEGKEPIDAIVASNDGTAGGAILALGAHQLAGKVAVSGQDAEVDACKRVLAGTQTMTVYKPLKLIASEAAKLAVMLVKGEKVIFTHQVDNGKGKADSLLLPPTVLTKDNMGVLVDDGFYTQEQLGM